MTSARSRSSGRGTRLRPCRRARGATAATRRRVERRRPRCFDRFVQAPSPGHRSAPWALAHRRPERLSPGRCDDFALRTTASERRSATCERAGIDVALYLAGRTLIGTVDASRLPPSWARRALAGPVVVTGTRTPADFPAPADLAADARRAFDVLAGADTAAFERAGWRFKATAIRGKPCRVPAVPSRRVRHGRTSGSTPARPLETRSEAVVYG